METRIVVEGRGPVLNPGSFEFELGLAGVMPGYECGEEFEEASGGHAEKGEGEWLRMHR